MNQNQTYKYYKRCEKQARVAAMTGEYLKAERLFLAAAQGRKDYCMKFCGGSWGDAGHKARYDICVGSAWIQREAYETELQETNICYERTTCGTTPKWSLWRTRVIRQNRTDNFDSFLKQHEKIKKRRRRNKN